MLEINSENISNEVFIGAIPVVVDAYATWCAPCRAMAPIFESLAQEFDGKMKFVKMNIEDNQEFASEYKIMSIPTFLIFKDGKEVSRKIGAFNKDNFKTELTSLL